MIHLEVAVAAPLFSTLTYLFQDDNEDEVGYTKSDFIGCQVLVPLGNRTVTGYIVEQKPVEQCEYKLRAIREIVDDQPLFHANMVPFFRWIAEYYQYPIGEVIATALPPGLKRSSQKIVCLKKAATDFSEYLRLEGIAPADWCEDLLSKKKLSPKSTKKIFANTEHAKILNKLQRDEIVEIKKKVSKQHTKAKLETCYSTDLNLQEFPSIDIFNREEIQTFGEDLSNRLEYNLKLSETKALYYFSLYSQKSSKPVPRKEILKQYRSGGSALEELCRKGILKKTEKRIYRNPLGEVPEHPAAPESLTEEQILAIEKIKKSVQEKIYETFLLHGVTGSGKTEVYLQAAQIALDNNRDVLVLVPEIALATQLEAHFLSRFGNRISLLHSGLSKGEKYDQWTLAASGVSKIVIGARSAVFAPLKNIGLIVVDEEHDSGFKQDDNLKYNGRDLAVLRAKLQNCTVILGSATPSITSYYHAKCGKYTILTMTKRVGKSQLPQVKIIDINKVSKDKKGLFHHDLLNELRKNLDNGEQSLLLINRRGFSTSLLCQECGSAIQCRHCNVALTYHKKKDALICHYCGYRVSSKLICENCRSDKLVPLGAGTERIEDELGQFFPTANIARLDSDTAFDRKRFLSILKAMKNQEIDILIGTQMIAKGHHFPNVTFVGVVWADGGLNMPDFRAAERTYQLLSQVTGRAGRGEINGRVIIQTMRPQHYVLELAKEHKYDQFFQREMAIRKHPQFPPYVRLACYKIDGTNEYEVRKSAENTAQICRKLADKKNLPIEVLGPASSPLEKIKDRYRWQVLLKSPQPQVFKYIGEYIHTHGKHLAIGKTRIMLDRDPENMM